MEHSNHLGKKLQKRCSLKFLLFNFKIDVLKENISKLPHPITNLKNMIAINWHFSNES